MIESERDIRGSEAMSRLKLPTPGVGGVFARYVLGGRVTDGNKGIVYTMVFVVSLYRNNKKFNKNG